MAVRWGWSSDGAEGQVNYRAGGRVGDGEAFEVGEVSGRRVAGGGVVDAHWLDGCGRDRESGGGGVGSVDLGLGLGFGVVRSLLLENLVFPRVFEARHLRLGLLQADGSEEGFKVSEEIIVGDPQVPVQKEE